MPLPALDSRGPGALSITQSREGLSEKEDESFRNESADVGIGVGLEDCLSTPPSIPSAIHRKVRNIRQLKDDEVSTALFSNISKSTSCSFVHAYLLKLKNLTYTMTTKIQEQLTLEGAKIAIAASEKKAREIGVDMNIAVVDASTNLIHFSRMPNAKITSITSM